MSTSDDDHKTETGAKGQGSADSATPFSPSEDDDTPVGDTDQHSKVPHDGPTPEEDAARQDPQSTD